jgi:hypothetical protein
MYRHIVLFRIAKEEDRARLIEMIKELPNKLDFLHDLEVGKDVKHLRQYQSDNTFDIGFSCSFDTLEDLQRYYAHPVHIELRTALRAVRQDTAMVDWVVG